MSNFWKSAVGGIFALPLMISSVEAQEIPDNITNVGLEAQLKQTINEALPEGRAVDAAFLNPTYDANINLSDNAQVSVTFVDEGAGYKNSLGYFTFQNDSFSGLTKNDIDTDGSGVISVNELNAVGGVETGIVFANASYAGKGGSLTAGDSIVLGGGLLSMDGSEYVMNGGTVFDAGTNVGFFLSQNSWTGSGVKGIDTAHDPQVMFTADFLNPEAVGSSTYASTFAIDQQVRHTAMLFADDDREEIIMGFEDLNRTNRYENDWRISSDEDFNDAVFIVRTNPVTAIAATNIATAGDPPVRAAPGPIAGFGPMGLLGFIGFSAWRRRKMSSSASEGSNKNG